MQFLHIFSKFIIMQSIVTKTLDGFTSFATQIEGSLSSKQIDQMQALCDKCIPFIAEYDKAYYVKLLTSVLKLLLLCPDSYIEPIYARYNSLLQWGPSKYKLHDKYECIIAALLGTVEQIQTSCFAIDVTVCGLLLGACSNLGLEMKSKDKDFLKSIMLIADTIYSEIHSDLNEFGEQTTNFDDDSVNNAYLTERLITLSYSKFQFYSANSKYSKMIPSNILRTLIEEFQGQDNSPFSSSFYLSIKNNQFLTIKSKIYLSLIFWISLRKIENISDMYIERRLCEQLKDILKDKAVNGEQNQFIVQLYLSLGLKTNLQNFISIVIGPQQIDNNSSQIFQILYQRINDKNQCQQQFKRQLQKMAQRIYTSKITLQNFIDFLTKLFETYQSQQQLALSQSYIVPSFSKLSLILFDKINLKPANREICLAKNLSFQQKSKNLKIIKSKLLLKYFYEIDSSLKANKFLINTVPITDVGQKLIVTCLKKYYNTTFGRINQNTIRGWVQEKRYLLIWSMLLSSYKVKTISEQFLKCGVNSDEIRSIFPLQKELAKEYVQYLISKDRLKLRLILWDLNLLHRQYLSECTMPQLLL